MKHTGFVKKSTAVYVDDRLWISMGRIGGSLIPGLLAALHVAVIGIPCVPVEAARSADHVAHVDGTGSHALPVQAPHVEQSGHGVAEQTAPFWTASCPCGCRGGTAEAAPARNLGDALFLGDLEPLAPQTCVLQVARLHRTPQVPQRVIDHVPLHLG